MKVYIITHEPYHDNSTILGVFSSLDSAKTFRGYQWMEDSWYVSNTEECVASAEVNDEVYLITAHEVKP